MKKLMVVMAVMVAAVAANAATVKWAIANVNGEDGNRAGSDYSVVITVLDAGTTGVTGATPSLNNGASAGTFSATASTGTVIFEATVVHGDKSVYMGKQTIVVESPTSTYTARWTSGVSKDDWQSVPEPTSGMLLLLGVAGLALRRRRA